MNSGINHLPTDAGCSKNSMDLSRRVTPQIGGIHVVSPQNPTQGRAHITDSSTRKLSERCLKPSGRVFDGVDSLASASL